MAVLAGRTVRWRHYAAGTHTRNRSRTFPTAEEAAGFLAFAHALEELTRCQARLARARTALELATAAHRKETDQP